MLLYRPAGDNMEEKFIILNEIPDSFKSKFIGRGCSGECYLTSDGLVYKSFFNNAFDFNYIKMFTNIKNESVIFPSTICYKDSKEDKNIVGYLMEYVEGDLFKNINQNISVHLLINECDKAEKNIKKLSTNNRVIMEEINPANVIIKKDNTIKIIDTDFYSLDYSNEDYILYRNNIYEWGNMVLSILGDNYPFKSDRLNKLYERCVLSGEVKPSIVLYEIYDMLTKVTNEKIETLDEYKKNLRLIKE